MKSFEGYLKQTAGDTYLLLAGGGIKPLSDFLDTNSFKTINGQSLIGTGDISIGGISSVSWNDITSKPSTFTPSAHDHGPLLYIYGTSSDLPRVCWHIPNVNWGNISLNTSGVFSFRTGNSASNGFASVNMGSLLVNGSTFSTGGGLFGGSAGVYIGATYNGNSSSAYDCIERAGAGNTLYLQYYHSGGVNMCHGGGEVRIEGGTFTVINDSCNTAFDALAYFRHYSNNDWGISIDKGNYDYGLRVWGAGGASNAIVTNGYVACYSTRSTSDRIKKCNIKSISKLFPIVEFNWKHNNKKSYGFIALDIIKLGFQDIVYGEEGNMSLEYNAMLSYYLALLSNIVYDKHQEIDNRINMLEKRIHNLETPPLDN